MNSDFVVAVHAMVFLHHKGETVSSDSLADNICTNPVRIRRVMAKLKKAGLVETHMGAADGGYAYKKTKRVTLADIGEALHTEFADFTWRSGDKEKNCLISSGMSDYMDGLLGEMNRRCKEYLRSLSIAEVEKQLTGRKQSSTCPPGTQNREK